jgi:hypothetical protein
MIVVFLVNAKELGKKIWLQKVVSRVPERKVVKIAKSQWV